MKIEGWAGGRYLIADFMDVQGCYRGDGVQLLTTSTKGSTRTNYFTLQIGSFKLYIGLKILTLMIVKH